MLERTLASCTDTIQNTSGSQNVSSSSKCESLSSLTSSLERLLHNVDKFVLIIDGIDEQREAPPNMLPAISRLGELIPGLTVV